MAGHPNDNKSGYEESRFKTAVDENFLCSICLNIVKDARMCRHNEHIFCRYCIEEHLRVNAQRCPQCQDNLTAPTLLPARFVNNMISKFKINCDYASRGCPEFIKVEDLERHVENCGFAPVLCSNERCGKEINKRDKIKHETKLCEYRKIPSHDFEEIREMFQRNFDHVDKVKVKMDAEVGRQYAEIRKEMMESKREIKDVQQNLSLLTKEIKDMKVMMFQILEKMNKNEQHVQTLTSPIEIVINTLKSDILVAGGYSPGSSKSVEIFSWKKVKWFEIASMENAHVYGSSFIYNDILFVVGGVGCKSMETLNIKQFSLRGRHFPQSFLMGVGIIELLFVNNKSFTLEDMIMINIQHWMKLVNYRLQVQHLMF
ncbi:E3 ubiquitin-protein ligase NRDP1-like [Xenia sp. Carnegie-2017]|uniref:E3 ubiquitin-protein ligase NRDP1-like n=1 Tax=Xenia sp. Carnegie-2017 TaxID=2897299 RepID=UPI001F035FC4|nr:E3 ubiquitin-protein ligase NRDP1-like [Xenia sp. Carnegie-2017]